MKRKCLVFLMLILAPACLAGEMDFNIKLHTKLNELLLGMRDEIRRDGIPSESRLADLMEKKTENLLEEVVADVANSVPEKTRGQKMVALLTREIEWKKIARSIRDGVRRFENVAAQRGLVAFTILASHLSAGWVLPPVFLMMHRPELILAVWGYPVIMQGGILAVVGQKITDAKRLRRIYGEKTLNELINSQDFNRRQLALIGADQVLLPVARRFGEFNLAINNPGVIEKMLGWVMPYRRGLSWKDFSRFFSDTEETKNVVDHLDRQKDLTADEKSAFLISYVARERPARLDELLAAHPRDLSRVDQPTALFRELETWAEGLKKVTSAIDALRVLEQAPESAPAHVVWSLWKELGIPVFLKANLQMNFIERRSWVLAADEMHAKSFRDRATLWNRDEVQIYSGKVVGEKDAEAHKILRMPSRLFNSCFLALKRSFTYLSGTVQP